MKIENTIKIFKETYANYIIFIKLGTFYHVYGKDAYVLSYLFNYQIKKSQSNYNSCGFPISALEKVILKLKELHINYLIIENNEETDKKDFEMQNKYCEIYNKSYNYFSKKIRVDSIYQFLLESMAEDNIKDTLVKIEQIINENY